MVYKPSDQVPPKLSGHKLLVGADAHR